MKIAIYPGTFDPITHGHIDVVERAVTLFDRVVITIAINAVKKPLFSVKERQEMIAESTKHLQNIEVDAFEGLLMEYAKRKNAVAVIRGLRAISDFEYELQMALMNRKLAEEVVTVFLMPNVKYTYLNSTIVKEVAGFGGDVSGLVPESVEKRLQKKFRKNGI
ncbi:phosphopantetheine adenylyltransferase [bacterium BMS3Abin05]|nr:phosphopantetheine adenylyltransferase [bacterium BMS3Abin05]GBE28504.1 phosphopantetheine adenylyltransferase [bacterium BMS3Bbin03]HDL78883.1 pantetheine-phosphate adenylyltransferase [Bacteroidota bacterium]HDZ10804.1 pantetheine-phosphate adenylyltransferase [Bacteroidota bacterium]